ARLAGDERAVFHRVIRNHDPLVFRGEKQLMPTSRPNGYSSSGSGDLDSGPGVWKGPYTNFVRPSFGIRIGNPVAVGREARKRKESGYFEEQARVASL